MIRSEDIFETCGLGLIISAAILQSDSADSTENPICDTVERCIRTISLVFLKHRQIAWWPQS